MRPDVIAPDDEDIGFGGRRVGVGYDQSEKEAKTQETAHKLLLKLTQ
jgi:hypothetical protein